MIKTKTISAKIKNGVRWVKVQIWGPGDIGEAPVVSPFGVDSSPIAGMQAIYGGTSANGINNVIGYILPSALAEPGETRTYSTDANGTVKAYMWHKGDGTTHINGDADYAVLFNKLKEEFDELQDVVNDMVSEWNSFCTNYIPGSPSVAGAPLTLSTATVAPSMAVIDNAKNERIKTND